MPIEVGIWKVNDQIERIEYDLIESEEKLEDIIEKDVTILGENLLLVGRQISTKYGKYIDVLALDQLGNTVIIELKKGRTSREVVSQAIDYASWVQELSYEEIVGLYKEKNKKSLQEAFVEKFDEAMPEELNESHRMIIVSSALDLESERIINYLVDNFKVPINAVFFRYFKDGNNEYLSRSWFKDPKEIQDKALDKMENKKEKWNGNDFVVNFDDGQNRSWKDAVKYGFVSAGNGRWYSRTLEQLKVGRRVFCMVPKKGYVGIGTVSNEVQPLKDVMIENAKGEKELMIDQALENEAIKHDINDVENCEYVVQINWEITIPVEQAYWEKGLRANQNSAFKLRNQYTIDKVEAYFKRLEESKK